MMKHNICKIASALLLTGFLINSVCFAQNTEFTKANFPKQKRELKAALNNIKNGDKIYSMGKGMYLDAINYYLKAQEFNPNNAELNYKIGVCYLSTIQKAKAATYLEKAQQLSPKVSPDINYLLAQAYQLDLQFDNAISKYEEFKNSLSQKDLPVYTTVIEKKIRECIAGKTLIAKPIRVFIDNIGNNINGTFPDYSPIINADESVIIFTSRRDNTIGGKKDPTDFSYYEDIYISHKQSDTSWSAAYNPGKPLNTDFHDATVGFSPDGQILYTYRGDNGGDLYECKLEGDQWSKPKRMGTEINTKYHETSASLSFDNRKIYFVSNKPGGYGGSDIYVSEKNTMGEWGPATNLGPVINTQYDEEGVFMLPDGKTLYFSSKGHKTMGGYDIFKSEYENGRWSEPENIGYPINTPDDDVFFSVSASGKHGYYSSGMAGGYGSLDIYVVTIVGQEKPILNNTEDNLLATLDESFSDNIIQEKVSTQSSQLTLLIGTILDDKTNEPVKAQIELFDTDMEKDIGVFESNSKTGKYLVSLPSGKNYGLTVKADGYLFYSENFNISADAAYNEITKDIRLQPITLTGATKYSYQSARRTLLKGTVTDKITKKPVKAQLEIYDISLKTVIGVLESNSETGKYLIYLPSGRKYGITAKADQYVVYSENINIPNKSGISETTKDIELQPLNITAQQIEEGNIPGKNMSQRGLLKGTVYDKATKLPVKAQIEIYDVTLNTISSVIESESGTGKYLQYLPSGKAYALTVKADGYYTGSETVSIPDKTGINEVIKDIMLQPLGTGTKPGKEIVQEKVTYKTLYLTPLKGTIRDKNTKQPIKAQIEVSDNDLGTVISFFESNSNTGKYLLSLPSGKNYGITAKADGYLFHSENFVIPADTSFKEIIKDIDLQPIEAGASIILKNIFYDYNKYSLRPQSKVELENIYSILTTYPTMKIEISGHTDSRGTEEYNQGLSYNRAKIVVDYLVNKGIEESRLIYKGYGELQPIAPNDTEENMQLNRRTEFKIISK